MSVYERIVSGAVAFLFTTLLSLLLFLANQNVRSAERLEDQMIENARLRREVDIDLIGRVSKIETILESWDRRYQP